MNIIHVSAECYPAAKVGGLGDVVGALPKYQSQLGADVKVIIPAYMTSWITSQKKLEIYCSELWNPQETIAYSIMRVEHVGLGFQLYVVDISGKFDRGGIYSQNNNAYTDDPERWTAFQTAALDWIFHMDDLPDIVHCHDHHSGLIPFLLSHAYGYKDQHRIKTVFTIHNEKYHGEFGWDKQYLLPHFDNWKSGLLDWNHRIDPLTSAIRCADHITTVSPSYLQELRFHTEGYEWLFDFVKDKSSGILNGIDITTWNPSLDNMIFYNLRTSFPNFKKKNKKYLCQKHNLNPELPLISFIGRMVFEKGTDILSQAIDSVLSRNADMNFIILGTGDPKQEQDYTILQRKYHQNLVAILEYNEGVAHQIYASSDFLIMPSRVEPCGLNQMYAMRYGTIPIVNSVGGLLDSVIDYQLDNGTGIKLKTLSTENIIQGIQTAKEIYQDKVTMDQMITNCRNQDFSWTTSSQEYLELYGRLIS